MSLVSLVLHENPSAHTLPIAHLLASAAAQLISWVGEFGVVFSCTSSLHTHVCSCLLCFWADDRGSERLVIGTRMDCTSPSMSYFREV